MIRSIQGLILLCSLLMSNANAQDVRAMAQLERFSVGLESLHARFEQQVISNDGEVQDSSSGRVWLSRPQLFRWEYGGDFPELVVADGSRIWIYDETLEQVTVRKQSDAALDSPLNLITNPGRLEEHFIVREIGEADQLQLLELTARSQESEFERIVLGLGEDQLSLMIMEDAFGLRTEIRFDGIERNPPIDASLFTFTPPESADVIGDYSGSGGEP